MRARGTRQSLVLGLLALCVSSLLAPTQAMAQSEGMPWRTDFQAARAEAQQSGKLLLVHFWTESCGPCKLLETRVFSQPQVAVAISNEYIPVKVNANESPEIAQAYGVTRVPTDVIVTAQGQLVHSFVSPATPMEYVGLTTQVASAYRSQTGGAYAAAVAKAPAPATTYADNKPTTPTATQQTSPNAAFAAYAASMQPQTPPVASNPYAAQAQAPAQQQLAPQQQMNPAAMVAQAQPSVQPQTQAQPPQAQQQPPVVASAAPQLPPGSPALGFEGFCPVTMKNEWRWAKGDVRWGAIHQGRTYLFASAEAQKTFLTNPDAFSPVLAGSDPVAAVDKQQTVPGVREFAVEYEGRFYLFANEQSLEKFWSNPTAYAQGAQRVAAQPAGGSMIR
jgi:thioredoxin-like negative regulator of GroEL/YHS domain-containing protein